VTGWRSPAEPSLDDIRREFPDWEISRSVSGRCHADLNANPPAHAVGEDPLDLRDQIIKWKWQHPDGDAQQPLPLA
jgi:hypothetical protein